MAMNGVKQSAANISGMTGLGLGVGGGMGAAGGTSRSGGMANPFEGIPNRGGSVMKGNVRGGSEPASTTGPKSSLDSLDWKSGL